MPNLLALADLRPLGQLHESFIIAAGRDGLWIIDQHVAHERILFEKVLKQRAAGRVEMQRLLMPMMLQLTAAQQIEYARIAEELNAIGLRDRAFRQPHHRREGRAGRRRRRATSRRLLFEILEIAEKELRRLSMEDLRRAIAASIACRRPSRSTRGWTDRRWNGCWPRWPPPTAP